ncbi:heterokaryon incompatibility protein or allele [Diplodia corticola]|uniref:Heterokaryon incompatibility protein or allele n=1 Tax=Diplodia corticola TaxID=236234 RepID=A0A1J9QLL8_9PEZI|nr:heterokaryon incompatibility protein or allele [Diplodia corticola]OJD28962.1 heterokaryon incompatibility protein or allele [Diplodia corticola]
MLCRPVQSAKWSIVSVRDPICGTWVAIVPVSAAVRRVSQTPPTTILPADEADMDSDEKVTIRPTSSQDPFRYQQLNDASEFRLLRLFPGSPGDKLGCDIFHVNLRQLPRYEAVSYTWGNDRLCQELYSTKGLIKITDNCAHALTALRYPEDERVLWIDCVCIAQADKQEKNHQIPLMPQIYAGAKCVLIHLHHMDTSGNTERLLDLLRKRTTASACRTHRKQMAKLLSLPWFSRIWVLQEVVAASRAIIVIGTESLNWQYLSIANIQAVGLGSTDLRKRVPPVLLLSDADTKPLKDHASLLAMARSCLSGDPLDRIYALLGLVDERAGINVTPDYNKSARELYTDVTLQFLRKDNCLDFLSDTGQPKIAGLGPDAVSTFPDARDMELEFLRAVQPFHDELMKTPSTLRSSKQCRTSRMRTWRLLWEKIDSRITNYVDKSAFKSIVFEDWVRFFNDMRAGFEKAFSVFNKMTYDPDPELDRILRRRYYRQSVERIRLLEANHIYSLKKEVLEAIMEKHGTLLVPEYLFGRTKSPQENAEGLDDEDLALPSWVLDFRHHARISSFARCKPDKFSTGPVARFQPSTSDYPKPSLQVMAVFVDKVSSTHRKPGERIQLWHTSFLFEGEVDVPYSTFQQDFAQDLSKVGHGATLETIRAFAAGRKVALTERSLAILPANFRVGDIIAVVFGSTVPYLLRRRTSEADRFEVLGECYLHGIKGPKCAPDYADLLGCFKGCVLEEAGRAELPWRTIFLE